ncbi:MAG: pyocin knob domain-containing protein, partial [Muribaculaceae bacterium]|nr:pyocin knob domain-containing protein [Muribaculaceae bacterium]
DANGTVVTFNANNLALSEKNLDISAIKDSNAYLGIFANVNLAGAESLPYKEAGGYISIGSINGRPMQIYGTYMSNRWFARGANSSSAGTFTAWREFAFLDSNVASSDKLTTKLLTNEDLNTIKDVKYSVYRAASNNTVTNKPSGTTGFTLQCFGYDSTFIVQLLITIYGNVYKRLFRDVWSKWERMLTEDDITLLTARVAALEAKS